jgi:hypothetical protein
VLKKAFAALQVIGLYPIAAALIAFLPGPNYKAKSNVQALLICYN